MESSQFSLAYNAMLISVRNELKSQNWEDKDVDLAITFISTYPFKANENIFEVYEDVIEELGISKKLIHEAVRKCAEFALTLAFKGMMIELDSNTKETPARIAKVWCGDGIECDSELGGGRFSLPVRIPTFPNTQKNKSWVTINVRLIATCSHHFLPFIGEAQISYRPGAFVLGISKFQRVVDYIANRFWLQEDLTREIHKAVVEAAQVDEEDVKVKLVAKHGCMTSRGVKNASAELKTEE